MDTDPGIRPILDTLINEQLVVETDTRKLNHKRPCIFWALKGENHDGNAFIEQAIEQGAKYAVTDNPQIAQKIANTFFVPDALLALQQTAKAYRQRLNIPILAIVGSNGKTTTKELIALALSPNYKVFSTPGNLNNHIGLPLSILQITPNHTFAILEMGANHLGEIAELTKIALPNFGIITNIGKDHLEGFGSEKGAAQANKELFDYLEDTDGVAFFNPDLPYLSDITKKVKHKVTYPGPDDDFYFIDSPKGIFAGLKTESGLILQSRLFGHFNFLNLAAALAISSYFGVPQHASIRKLETYNPSNKRSQVIYSIHNTIILDAYNANPSSMEVALADLAEMDIKRLILILGDMLELGEFTEKEHKNLGKLCAKLGFDTVYFIGENMRYAADEFEDGIHFNTTNEAFAYFEEHRVVDASIFLKGSRGMQLEQLIDLF